MIMADHFVKTKDGRVGLATNILYNVVNVQFGTDGPRNFYPDRDLNHASRAEVDAAGLEGVPGKIWGEL